MISKSKQKKINSLITRRIIELQSKGYDLDYVIAGGNGLLCIQNNLFTRLDDTVINLVDLGYDHLNRNFKYIHTVENGNGERGMLIADIILSVASNHSVA
ncbi:hypothetical protein SNE26_24420 [Mucilaginibacter sp. cycad4]|uniref:hypothetical protein n=1 Tax=Mucilaginibacter sp. cycad4 TaxID=3342096 RepID=UPI002AABED16|nr:hypothetical protein [Mucilaginibacter gossypii]WPU99162.1 hypothetical protein SNE26_24420 [Mucilaginibacter gossypii]